MKLSTKTKQALVRAFRTFLQAFIGTYLATFTASPDVRGLVDPTLVGVSVVAGVIAVLSFVQNYLEGKRDVHYDRG